MTLRRSEIRSTKTVVQFLGKLESNSWTDASLTDLHLAQVYWLYLVYLVYPVYLILALMLLSCINTLRMGAIKFLFAVLALGYLTFRLRFRKLNHAFGLN